MEALVAIISIGWSILGIILFFKIWEMTNNVKEMHDWLMEDRFKRQQSRSENTHSFTPNSERKFEELPEKAISAKPFKGNLKKGDRVTIAEYGTCTFEGVWQEKYAFYPDNKTDLPESPYLVDDVEPYLLIPPKILGSMIV